MADPAGSVAADTSEGKWVGDPSRSLTSSIGDGLEFVEAINLDLAMTAARDVVVDDVNARVFVSGDDRIRSTDFSGGARLTLDDHPGAAGMAIIENQLFVVESDTGDIARIDLGPVPTETGRFDLGLTAPRDLVAAGGYLWTTTGGCDDAFSAAVVRVDPSTGTPVVYDGALADLWCPSLVATGSTLIVGERQISPPSISRFDVTAEPPSLEVNVLVGEEGAALGDMAITPDAQGLIVTGTSATATTRVRLSDLQTNGVVQQVGAVPTAVGTTGANGGLIAVGSANTSVGTLGLYRPDDPTPLWTHNYGTATVAGTAAFDATGQRLFAVARTTPASHSLIIVDVTVPTDPPIGDPAGEFTALDPARVYDSRGNPGRPVTKAAVALTGLGGVPGTGVAAVAVNVTVTDATAPGYLSLWPTGTPQPNASNVNYNAGETTPNMAMIGVGESGQITFATSSLAHVLIDVVGWFSDSAGSGTGGRYHPILPTRWFDTRTDPRNDGSILPVPGGGSVSTSFTGGQAIDTAHISSVMLNVTVTQTTSESYLTASPFGVVSKTSNLNWRAGDTVPNAVAVKLDPDNGAATFTNAFGTTDVLVDAFGYWDDGVPSGDFAGARFVPLNPVRAADTRTGYVAPGSAMGTAGRVEPYDIISFRSPVPEDAIAVALNIIAVDPDQPGYLSAFPLGLDPEVGLSTSIMNFTGADFGNRANFSVMPLGFNNEIVIANLSAGSIDLIADVTGYFVY